VALGSTGVLPAIVQIALAHDAKGTDGGEHATFSAVDLVHAIAVSYGAALASARQVEVLREHVARIMVGSLGAFAAPAATAAVSVAEVAAFAVI
jgi:hypothetical protein